MAKKKKRWSHSAGSRPHRVTVYERSPGGPLYARVWNPRGGNGHGAWVRLSLGHRDQEAARAYALEQAAKIVKGVEDLKDGKITLRQVLTLYARHHTPRKSEGEQQADERRTELWTRVLGANKNPHTISLERWQFFIDRRRTGEMDARGNLVAETERRDRRNEPGRSPRSVCR